MATGIPLLAVLQDAMASLPHDVGKLLMQFSKNPDNFVGWVESAKIGCVTLREWVGMQTGVTKQRILICDVDKVFEQRAVGGRMEQQLQVFEALTEVVIEAAKIQHVNYGDTHRAVWDMIAVRMSEDAVRLLQLFTATADVSQLTEMALLKEERLGRIAAELHTLPVAVAMKKACELLGPACTIEPDSIPYLLVMRCGFESPHPITSIGVEDLSADMFARLEDMG